VSTVSTGTLMLPLVKIWVRTPAPAPEPAPMAPMMTRKAAPPPPNSTVRLLVPTPELPRFSMDSVLEEALRVRLGPALWRRARWPDHPAAGLPGEAGLLLHS
jgi:hypothetical protein